MALQITTIATNIAALTVGDANIPIYDIDKIPSTVLSKNCPMFAPNPDNYVSNFLFQRDSFGSGDTAQITVQYTLQYRLYSAKAGAGRGLMNMYASMVANCAAFIDTVILNDDVAGAVDMVAASIPHFGLVSDPAGEMFHGADILLTVKEFVN